MKSFTSLQIAAAGIMGLASLAQAQSLCAVNCFQSVITEHPPLSCTEATMYLCFCKTPSLQNYFVECVYKQCANEAESAVGFGVNLCKELGAPISVPPRPADPTTTSSAAAQMTETSSAAPEPATSKAAETSAAVEPTKAVSSDAAHSSHAASTDAKHTAVVEPSKSSMVSVVHPTPSGVTTPPPTKPTDVKAMGVNVMIPGFLAGAAAVVAAVQLL